MNKVETTEIKEILGEVYLQLGLNDLTLKFSEWVDRNVILEEQGEKNGG
ncbi:MAG: hypothetical protein R3Y64_10670 [Peptostreptococcaceae bacterium]